MANTTIGELLRFGLIGVALNASLYGLYVLLSIGGMPETVAMTSTFLLGILLAFTFNGRWTFGRQLTGRAFIRFWFAYGVAWAINMAALLYFYHVLQFSHFIVQAIMVPSLAVALFIAQKFWIFRSAIEVDSNE